MNKKYIAPVASLLVLSTLLSGCGSKTNEQDSVKETNVKTTESKTGDNNEPTKLKYWVGFSSTSIETLKENEVYKKIENDLNIDFEFIHPPKGQSSENYNLLIAANDLPDIFESAPKYPGGPDRAIADGVYLRLNEAIEQYAPDYKAVLNYNDEIRRQVVSAEGNIWSFECIQLAKEPAWGGAIIREDYLNRIGMEAPQTMDDWYKTLKAMKDQITEIEYPLLFPIDDWRFKETDTFIGSYGITNDFVNENKTVKYGPIEPAFKEFVTVMNKWYEEGLIDPDFVTRDSESRDALFTSGKAGASIDAYGEFDRLMSVGKGINQDFEIMPVGYPLKDENSELHIRQTNPYVRNKPGVITTACENVEAAVKFFNYGYTDEGYLLYNYGVEGQAYELSDEPAGFDKDFFPENLRGKAPKFTDLMLKNPDGLTFWQAVKIYKKHQWPYLRNPLSIELSDIVKESMDTWGASNDDWVMPKIVLTDEENREYSAIMSEVETYQKEMMYKFIMGVESINSFDNYVATLKQLGIERAVEIKQSALDRYYNN